MKICVTFLRNKWVWHLTCYARSSYSQKALVSHPKERATLNGCPHRPPLLICVRARAGPRFTLHRNDLRDKSKKRAQSDAANGRGHSTIVYYIPCTQHVISYPLAPSHCNEILEVEWDLKNKHNQLQLLSRPRWTRTDPSLPSPIKTVIHGSSPWDLIPPLRLRNSEWLQEATK